MITHWILLFLIGCFCISDADSFLCGRNATSTGTALALPGAPQMKNPLAMLWARMCQLKAAARAMFQRMMNKLGSPFPNPPLPPAGTAPSIIVTGPGAAQVLPGLAVNITATPDSAAAINLTTPAPATPVQA